MTAPDVVGSVCDLIAQRGPCVLGIGGAPGAGKTTLARAIVQRVDRSIQISLDDFCYSRRERAERGLRWRAAVGSHDIPLIVSTLDALRHGRVPVAVPRYSTDVDDRVAPETVEQPPALIVFDGWLLGYVGDGYDRVRETIDLLVFLDVPSAVARERRFAREEKLRDAGGGLTEAQMEAFWDEVLGPSIATIVPRARASADVVVTGTTV